MANSKKLVAWFGREYFAHSLMNLGWQVFVYSYHSPRTFTWEEVVSICGQIPDVLVLGDRSHPPPFLGIEEFPCTTIFYSVDSHIHSWHPLYAQAFDACLVGLKDALESFACGRLSKDQLSWCPAYALNEEDMLWFPESIQWDVLFVGTVNREITPEREIFLHKLNNIVPSLKIIQGNFVELFPKGRIVLNVAERGDLNFRVFEALAMQKVLLTPHIGNGLLDIFEDGVDLVTYSPNDPHDCAAKANWLLANPVMAGKIALSGHEKVNASHRARHRARDFDCFLKQRLNVGNYERISLAPRIHRNVLRPLYLHWANETSNEAMKKLYFAEAIK